MAPNPVLISLAAFAAAFVAFVATFIAYLYIKMYMRGAALKRVNPTMEIRYSAVTGFQPLRMFAGDFFRSLGYTYANGYEVISKFEPYKDTEDAVWALVTPFHTEIRVANAEVVREIALGRQSQFPKVLDEYDALRIWGDNVVTVEGEEWKRHRRVTAPHFNEKNNAYVHDATVQTLQSVFAKWKENNMAAGVDETDVDVHNMMFRVALSVISDAAFGVKFDFHGDGYVPPGYRFSFQRSLEILSLHLAEYLAMPKWAFKLPIDYLRDIDSGFTDFHRHMLELVAKARTEKPVEHANVLNALVKAVDSETDPQKSLSESEMVSSMFIFLFAGHETTANVLSYATGYMAAYPEYQDKLYEETNKIVPLDQLPEYKHFSQLTFTMALMNETMRLSPTIPMIPKAAGVGPSGTDQFQPILGGKYQVPVRGNTSDPLLDRTDIYMCFIPLQRNPKYWGPDPDAFRPERWLNTDSEADSVNKYAFGAFSVGSRACLGKKFSQVEFVCALTMLNRYYTWRISDEMADEEVRKTGTQEQIQASARAACFKQLDNHDYMITLKPGPIKLLFKRRQTA